MWSRRFLWMGLSTGAAIALLTVVIVWLGLFAVSGSTDPNWTMANIGRLMLPGVIIYPACWYAIIFRSREYSSRRTVVLVAGTFGTGCALVAVLLIGGAAIMSTPQAGPVTVTVIYAVVSSLAYGIMTLIGAVILFIPYAMIATPMALLHRWLLLHFFSSSGPPTPVQGLPVA
jgi:hypothetical protein